MFKSMIKHKWISMMAVLGSVLMLGGLLAGPVLAFNDPQTQDLRMGGGDGVGTSLGDVVVTDDGTNLKVKYDLNVNAECVTDSDWELIETHIDASLTVAPVFLKEMGTPLRENSPTRMTMPTCLPSNAPYLLATLVLQFRHNRARHCLSRHTQRWNATLW